jgi:hypothetical protein
VAVTAGRRDLPAAPSTLIHPRSPPARRGSAGRRPQDRPEEGSAGTRSRLSPERPAGSSRPVHPPGSAGRRREGGPCGGGRASRPTARAFSRKAEREPPRIGGGVDFSRRFADETRGHSHYRIVKINSIIYSRRRRPSGQAVPSDGEITQLPHRPSSIQAALPPGAKAPGGANTHMRG